MWDWFILRTSIFTEFFSSNCNDHVKMEIHIITCFIRLYSLRKCPSGTLGIACEIKCSFPSFGEGCKQRCNCDKWRCNHIYGCRPPGNPNCIQCGFSSVKIWKHCLIYFMLNLLVGSTTPWRPPLYEIVFYVMLWLIRVDVM